MGNNSRVLHFRMNPIKSDKTLADKNISDSNFSEKLSFWGQRVVKLRPVFISSKNCGTSFVALFFSHFLVGVTEDYIVSHIENRLQLMLILLYLETRGSMVFHGEFSGRSDYPG